MKASFTTSIALLIGFAVPSAAPQELETVEAAVPLMPDARLFGAIQRAERDPAEVSAALQAGADPNARDEIFSLTALYAAVGDTDREDQSDLHILQLLIDSGSDPNAVNFGNAQTSLHRAASSCLVGSAQVLIGAGANVNARTDDGEAPIHRTCAPVAEVLIDAGANVDARELYVRQTPLHTAGTAGLARILIAAGADPNARDHTGDTPLHSAAFHCYPDVAQVLIEAGAHLDARNAYGNTPLHNAACTDTVWVLSDAGADPRARADNGDIPADTVFGMDFIDGSEEAAQLLRRMAGQ